MVKHISTRPRRARRQLSEHVVTSRKLQGLTTAQVAERAGISRSTYSRLENGGDVSLLAFIEVARSLNILEQVIDSLDPYETDLRRARGEEQLPQRVRRARDPS